MSDNVGPPTLDLLCDELRQVVEWDQVAVSLKVPFVDIKDIETRYSGLGQRKMHSLQKWLEQTSTVHSWRTVADAVQKINPFVAEQIRKKYAAILDQESSPLQHDKCPAQHEPPSELFRKQISELSEAIKTTTNFERLLNKFQSKGIITDTFADDVKSVEGDTAYQKASKVVHELHRQLKSRKDAEQYLMKITNVLLTEEDKTLRDIAEQLR